MGIILTIILIAGILYNPFEAGKNLSKGYLEGLTGKYLDD
tara:strand:- start:461 stop:580 length:120 start_codon:yes stop_codon:yes gene_type:complete